MTKQKYRSGHDWCSPSKLDLRFRCPGSVHLEQTTERPERKEGNIHMMRGRALHEFLGDLVAQRLSIADVNEGSEHPNSPGHKLTNDDIDSLAWCLGTVNAVVDTVEERNAILIEHLLKARLGKTHP